MKTIFITSFNPFILRNILETKVLPGISLNGNTRIVVFVPDYKKKFFIEKIKKENILIEGVEVQKISKQDIIFRYLNGSIINTKRLRIRHSEVFLKDRNIKNYIASVILGYLGYLPLIKKIIQFFDYKTINKTKFKHYFDTYKPDLVFSTDIFHNDDVHFLAEARYRKIKTIGMVRSWDNITNKGLFRVNPDKLIVHNDYIKKEVQRYQVFSNKNIFVSGIPQFDYYLKEYKPVDRVDYFKGIGLDPNNKTILFAPHGERFHHTDWEILQFFKESLLQDIQVIVRFPPNDVVNLNTFVPDSRFFIRQTGKGFLDRGPKDNEVEFSDTKSLADDLYFSDVVINYGSTISIDAAVFNKPVILVAFDGKEKLPYIKSVRRFFDYDHVKALVNYGFVEVVDSKKELLSGIIFYLENRKINENGRKKLIEDQVYKIDGLSCNRVAEYINKNL